jgi:hypothetical protein
MAVPFCLGAKTQQRMSPGPPGHDPATSLALVGAFRLRSKAFRLLEIAARRRIYKFMFNPIVKTIGPLTDVAHAAATVG